MAMYDTLRELRAQTGQTLEELASQVGVSKQTIHRYETGVIANIPSDKIEALAKALRTTPAHIMGWEEPVYEAAAGNGRIGDGMPTDRYASHLQEGNVLVKAVGDSMVPTINNGDLVVVKPQTVLDYPRQIALVKINGDEATLKRVEIRDDGVLLIGDNVSAYAPRLYSIEEVRTLPVTIEGVAIELIRSLA